MYKNLTVIQNITPSLSISTLLGSLLSKPAPHAVYVDHLMIYFCMHTASHISHLLTNPELLELSGSFISSSLRSGLLYNIRVVLKLYNVSNIASQLAFLHVILFREKATSVVMCVPVIGMFVVCLSVCNTDKPGEPGDEANWHGGNY